MYLVITRTFPPELGGMQNLMWGLARSLSKLNLIKVFADYHENHEEFDKSVSFSIERVSGMKLIRKYRKSYLINDYLANNKNIECLIADHWKSLELVKTNKKKICLIHSKEINHPKGSGLNKKVNYTTYKKCSRCTGQGSEPGSKPITCKYCGGRGKVRSNQGFFTVQQTCPQCTGSGEEITNPCTDCNGQGVKQKSKKISVTIPEGVDDGTRIRLAGKGEAGTRGGGSGD